MTEDGKVTGAQVTETTARSLGEANLKTTQLQQETADEYWESILESINDGFWVFDRSWRCTYINNRQAQLVGMPKEDVLGKNVWDLFPDLVGTEVYNQLHQAVAEQTLVHFEHFSSTWQGWFELRLYPSANGVSILTVDITDRKHRDALQDRQHFVQQLTEMSPGLLYLYDVVEQRNIYINARSLELLGYPPETVLATGTDFMTQAMHPDDLARMPAHFERLNTAQDGSFLELEYRMRHVNGEWRWFSSRDTVFSRTAQGQVRQILGTAQDITERKRAEEALRESEERFQAFMNHSPASAWVADEQGRLLYLSPTYFRMFQFPVQDAVGKNIFEIYPAEFAQQFIDNNKRVFETNQVIETIEAAPRPDGSVGEFLVYKFPIPSGEETLLGGVAVDITERRRAEEALRESEQQLKIALQTAKLGSWEHDLVTGTLSCSEQCQANFGLPPDAEFSHQTLFAALHPDDRDRVQAAIQRAVEEGTDYEVEERCFWPDGSLHWLIARGRLVYDSDGTPVRMVGVTLDVTDRKEFEESLKAANQKISNILESITDAFVAFDQEWRYTYVNPEAARLLKRSPEELLGRRWQDVFPEAARLNPQIYQQMYRAADEQVTVKIESFSFAANCWMEISIFPFSEGLAIYFRDISDRKREEQRKTAKFAVARVLAEATTLVDAVPAILQSLCESLGWQLGVIWNVDRNNQVLRYVNSWQSPTVNVQDFIEANQHTTFAFGVGLPGRIWESHQPIWIRLLQDDTNFPRAASAARGGLQAAFGFPIQLGDEILGVIECFSNTVQEPDEDLLQRMAAIGSHIGQFMERKRTEEALRESQELFQSFMNHSPIAAYIKDETGRHIYVNSYIERLFQRELTDLLGKTDFEVYPAEAAQQFRANDLAVLTSNQSLQFLETVQLEDGEHHYMSFKFPFCDASERQLLAGVTIDVTEQIRTREALETNLVQLEAVLHSMTDGLIIVDPQGNILTFNPAALTLHGFESMEDVHQHLQDVAHLFEAWALDGQPISFADWPISRAIAGETFSGRRIHVRRTDTGKYWVGQYGGTPVRNKGGEVILAIVTITDITAQYTVEEALRESEERLQLAQRAANIGTWDWNVLTGEVSWSEGIWNLLGLEQDNAKPNFELWSNFIHPDDRPRLIRQLEVAFAQDEEYYDEFRIIRRDGIIRWLASIGRIIRNANARVERMLGINLDITDRKQAEAERQQLLEQIRSEREFLEAVLQQMPAGVMVADAASGKIILSNEQIKHIWRIPELLPIDSIERREGGYQGFHPDGRPYQQQEWPLYRSVRTGEVVTEEEIAFLRGDGTRGFMLVNSAPIRDQEGNIKAGIATFYDISDRKRAQEALAQSQQELTDFVENAPLGMHWVSADGTILWANQCELDLVGYSRQEYIGQHIAEFHVDQDAIDDILQRLNRNETLCEYEARLRHKDGSIRYVSIHSNVFWKDGKFVHTRCFSQDITDRKRAEEAWRQSEERFQLIAQATNDVMWDFNALTNEMWWSERVQLVFGYRPEELGCDMQGWAERVHPADIERVQAHYEMCLLRTESFWTDEYRFRRADGSYAYLLDRAYIIRDAMGKPVRIVGAMTDISDRKQTEEALRKSERLYRAIGETIDYGIWVCEPDGRNIYASESFLRLVGLTQEQCSEFGWGDVLHPDDAPATIAAWKECTRSGDIWDIEHRFRGVDGNWHPILARGIPVRDENGEIICWAGINLDISRQKRVELQLRESEERFRALIEHAPDAILIANTEGTYIDVNTSACLLLGYERDELIGKQIIDIIPPEELPRLVEFKASLLTGNTCVQEWIILRKDGTPVSVEVSTKTLPDGRCQAFIRDITERKRAEKERERLLERERVAREQAEAANRIKDEFLAVLSHELRSPLNPILGWTRLLRTRKFDEQARDRALETIERNAKLQTQLIGDLLDVSRILQGKMVLNVCPVNLTSTIEAAIETVRLAADAKGIQIQTQLDSAVEPISGDPSRLQQIVWNLLSNAVKFTPTGGRVEVRLEQLESSVQIQVKDTGIGINREFLPHVFEYFRQENSTTTRTFGGLGLGLAIVRHLTELHGGTVQAESPGEGQGATFTVLLPRMVNFVKISAHHQPSTTTDDLSGLRILVVDDEADMRDLVVVILSEYGANVKVAASAAEALLVLEQFKPHVLVSDIGMPEVDGYTLMRQIRAMPLEQGSQIPAIALTAYAGELNQQQALAAGFQMHISKPVEPAELIKAILTLPRL